MGFTRKPVMREIGKYILHEWDSFGQFSLESQELLAKPFMKNASAYTNGSSFAGASMEDAIRMSEMGDAKGARYITEIAEQLMTHESFAGARLDYTYDTSGHILDLGRYVAGEPDHWATPEDLIADGLQSKLVRISFEICASAANTPKMLQARGATVAALAMILERLGFRTQIDIVCSVFSLGSHNSAWGKSNDLVFKFRVKELDNIFDVERLAFSMAHPAMFRRLMFGWMAWYSGKESRQFDGGLGRVANTPKEFRGDLHINGDEAYFDTSDARVQWIQSVIDKVQRPASIEHFV